ncbi:MAG: methyl-accepting chemotaxis protein [Roseburia sp.]|nr:methyl-accepting chemotaxis protein [Roseburia sp.]
MVKKLNKYRIKERLVHAFVLASGIPAFVAVIALITMIVVSNQYSDALEDYGFSQGDVGKSMTYFSEARSSLRACIGYDDEDAIEEMKEVHEQNIEDFTASFADLEAYMVTDANRKVYEAISKNLPAYWELDREIIELGGTTDRARCEEAQTRAMNELMPLYDEINDELINIMNIKVDRGDSLSNALSIACLAAAIVIAAIIAIAIFMSVRLGVGIALGISRPLVQLGDRLERFAEGDLSSPFPTVDTHDEVSDMVNAANDMSEKLSFIIEDIEHVLGRMAESDYTVRTRGAEHYTGEFEQMIGSLRKVRDGMVETIRFIGESSVQVSAGSGNLAETSQSLAEGATEQAGAVQELQATIMTIAEEARNAAACAEEAYHQSQRYADVADNSNADIKEMVEAMERINETSQKIGNIISEIESIASQTNLLSLNASIEAARAGEAGRGFSVVADQIRQLAEQSSKSAVDTRTLIEDAIREVENGNKVAGRAVASIETVVEGIREVANTSKELSAASTAQATTTKEAELGITQISDVVQTNAAVAQESSATSQELSAQAEQLDALIAKFVLPA